MDKEGINLARSLYYQCLGDLLSFSFTHTQSNAPKLRECLVLMRENAFDENLRKDFDTLLAVLDKNTISAFGAEFDELFTTLRGALGDTFSYLEEGFENSNALIVVRGILAKTTLRKNERKFKENEDNIGFCFSLMSELLRQSDDALAKELFESVINGGIDDFCHNLFIHEKARIYKSVANVISYFMEFERLCMNLEKPQSLSAKKVRDNLSRSEILRRETNQKRRQLEKSQRIS